MSEVMEQPSVEQGSEVASEPVKTRKYTQLTDAQKQAATLRRDATLLAKYGNQDKANELFAQAEQIAPERPKQSPRVDPLTVLTESEQSMLVNYFSTTKKGFAKIAQHISAKKLAEVAAQG